MIKKDNLFMIISLLKWISRFVPAWQSIIFYFVSKSDKILPLSPHHIPTLEGFFILLLQFFWFRYTLRAVCRVFQSCHFIFEAFVPISLSRNILHVTWTPGNIKQKPFLPLCWLCFLNFLSNQAQTTSKSAWVFLWNRISSR